MDNGNQLEEKWNKMGSGKDLETQFRNRAEFLMNKVCLKSGNNKYRVVDCEVYYFLKNTKILLFTRETLN